MTSSLGAHRAPRGRGPVGGRPTLPTGFAGLDRLCAITPRTCTVIFGPPGVGCSTLALNVATTCTKDEIPALFVSWESAGPDIVERALSAESRVHAMKMRSGALTEDDVRRLEAGTESLRTRPLSIASGPRSLSDLVALVELWRADVRDARALVVLDGAPNLARLVSISGQAVWEEHTRLSATIKDLAHRLDIAVVTTVPVVREAIHDPRRWPRLADVAYSPAYVTDADVVIAVRRPDYDDRESPRAGEADLIVLHSRHTPRDMVTVAFQGHFARFVDLA